MKNADYQALSGISSHWLIALRESPAHCWRTYLDPLRPRPQPTDGMRLGTLIHCLTLNPRDLPNEFLMTDYERRTQAGRAVYAGILAQGKTPIRPAELERAFHIKAALVAHREAWTLLRYGSRERPLIRDRGPGRLPLKARPDVRNHTRRRVVELKTTHNMDAVWTTMHRFSYPLSAAFYLDLSGERAFSFVFVETREPYRIEILDLDPATLERGRDQYREALARFDACWVSGHWPEAEPAPAWDDDPLMLPDPPPSRAGRLDRPLGLLDL